jgi:hypothetical protein
MPCRRCELLEKENAHLRRSLEQMGVDLGSFPSDEDECIDDDLPMHEPSSPRGLGRYSESNRASSTRPAYAPTGSHRHMSPDAIAERARNDYARRTSRKGALYGHEIERYARGRDIGGATPLERSINVAHRYAAHVSRITMT